MSPIAIWLLYNEKAAVTPSSHILIVQNSIPQRLKTDNTNRQRRIRLKMTHHDDVSIVLSRRRRNASMVTRTAVALLVAFQLLRAPSVVAFTTSKAPSSGEPLQASALPLTESPNPTLYDLLGVSRTASSAELKARYHQLAQRYHPDTTDGDATVFGQIAAAYHELRDSRPTYDRRIVADQCVEVLSHLVATTAVHTWRTVQGATEHVVAQVQQQREQQEQPPLTVLAAKAAATLERCFPRSTRTQDDDTIQQAAALEQKAATLLKSAAEQKRELATMVLDRLRHTLHVPSTTTSIAPWSKRPLPPRDPPTSLTSAEAELWIQHHHAASKKDTTIVQYLADLKEREGVLLQQQHVDAQLQAQWAERTSDNINNVDTVYLRDALHTSATELVRIAAETAQRSERVRRWIVARTANRPSFWERPSYNVQRERQLHVAATETERQAAQLMSRARRMRATAQQPVWHSWWPQQQQQQQ